MQTPSSAVFILYIEPLDDNHVGKLVGSTGKVPYTLAINKL